METHPIQFFYRHAGHYLRPYMDTTTFDPGTHCADCGVESSQWPEPQVGVSFNKYGTDVAHCTACHALYQGSFDLFGIEGYRSKTPVAGKLGMMTGVGALVSAENTTLFLNATGAKIDKAANPPPFERKRFFGWQAHHHVLCNPPQEPYLYIGDFGKKTDQLIANMTMSDTKTLVICSDSRQNRLPIEFTHRLIDATSELDKTSLNKLKTHLRLQLQGLEAPDNEKALKDFEKAAEQSPDLFPTLRQMPADPHRALAILTYI